LAVLALAGAASPAEQKLKPELLHDVEGWVYVGPKPLFRGAEPAWSPDGSQIAFSRRGSVWLANADGTGARALAPGGQPAWRPDGTLAYANDGRIVLDRNVVARGANPAFSERGTLAYDADGSIVVGRRTLTPGEDPAWSPNGQAIAFVLAGDLHAIGVNGSSEAQLTTLGDVTTPAWSPDGKRILFSSGGAVLTFDISDGTIATLARGTSPDWQEVPVARELLPDWDQHVPTDVYVSHHASRRVLAFRSEVTNVGRGPFWIQGLRAPKHTLMDATQLVRRSDGTVRRLRGGGFLRYDVYGQHHHWHLHPFERYELWRPGGAKFIARDHKQGFCLGDHFRTARAVAARFPPFQCGNYRPDLRSVEMGTSIGFIDIYPAEFHGQWIDITGVPDGRYTLVHRANPEFRFRERDYDNNVASALIVLRGGGVRVLKTCDRTETCR
jgi:hypothetical protein